MGKQDRNYDVWTVLLCGVCSASMFQTKDGAGVGLGLARFWDESSYLSGDVFHDKPGTQGDLQSVVFR